MNQAHILVVDDEPDIRELVRDILEDEGYKVTVADDGQAARKSFARNTHDLVLLDIWMPDVDGITLLKEWSSPGGLACPVVVMSGHGSVETAIEATRLGAHDFVQKPISLARLLSVVSQALEAGQKTGKPLSSPAQVNVEPIGSSALMQVLRNKAEQAAQHDLPVLISGEKGSGRENLARFIHAHGKRGGEFITMDHCELGKDKAHNYLLGSDGPAEDSKTGGIFARAHKGTLFIPELQEIPEDALKIIAQILDGERGSNNPDCRLIASTGVNILEQARDGGRLQQLYYRLNVLPLQIPPLRERPDDVPELVRFYAETFPNSENLPYRPFSVAAQNRLRNHSWPGNMRELRNLVQRLLVLGGDGEVSLREVEEALAQSPGEPAEGKMDHPPFFDLPLREAREKFEREYLVFKLKEAGGSVGKLAESVGMERTHLYRKLRALGVGSKSSTTSSETKK
jgi:DNA-binding NtrC family response regulator